MASYQWLQSGLPRYLRPGAHKLELKCHHTVSLTPPLFCWLESTFQLKVANLHQGMFRLMFTPSKHGKEDYLISSSVYGEIMVWTVCPIKGLECIWLVRHKIAGILCVKLS